MRCCSRKALRLFGHAALLAEPVATVDGAQNRSQNRWQVGQLCFGASGRPSSGELVGLGASSVGASAIIGHSTESFKLFEASSYDLLQPGCIYVFDAEALRWGGAVFTVKSRDVSVCKTDRCSTGKGS